MKLSLSLPRPLLSIPSFFLRHSPSPSEEKVVVVMGATGTGKTRLSIELANYFGAEVINSDKMQVFRGLEVTTNKVTEEERCGVPHHLLGIAEPMSEFSAGNFRGMAVASVRAILGRGNLPIIVGGSNSFVEALIDYNFCLRYECCFLWVDAAMPSLQNSLSDRVDNMIQRRMVEEVKQFYQPTGDYSKGILKSIGVPEFDEFFRFGSSCDDETRAKMLSRAITTVKFNTGKLACRQVEKIRRLRNINGWRLHRLDVTDVIDKSSADAEMAWDSKVAGPAAAIVSRFLSNYRPAVRGGVMATERSSSTLQLLAGSGVAA